jgi:molybdopterin-guanine dinucleotide biosynthesis protein A
MASTKERVAGLVLAGGRAWRMGGLDKGLSVVGGTSIIERVIQRLRSQVGPLAIAAESDAHARFGLPVLKDAIPDRAGPLSGILAGLSWARSERAAWLATAPNDTPFLPADLVGRLLAGAEAQATMLAMAASAGRAHPVIALWHVSIEADLDHAMRAEGLRKVDRFTARHACAVVDFEAGTVDPFLNVNTSEDLARAQALAGREVQ